MAAVSNWLQICATTRDLGGETRRGFQGYLRLFTASQQAVGVFPALQVFLPQPADASWRMPVQSTTRGVEHDLYARYQHSGDMT